MRAPAALREVLNLLLPPGCIACGSWIPARSQADLVCRPCRSRLKPAPWPRCPRCHHPLGTGRVFAPVCRECDDWPTQLMHARSAYALVPPADALVHALKYEGWAELAVEMGRDMARLQLPAPARAENVVVVPVPTTVKRVSERGYNQAELLAKSFSQGVGRPLVKALDRVRGGTTQVSLHPSERKANVKGAFAPRPGLDRSLNGAHAVLVDDVLTTGSTAVAAASALDEMGVSGVTLVTFARALPFRRTDQV